MTAIDVLNSCRRRGITLRVENGRLRFAPKAQMTAELLGELKSLNGELIRLLTPKPKPADVLIVLHFDGHVEVFGERGRVRVKIVNSLDVVHTTEALAETYLDAALPLPYRALHLPGNLLATGNMRDCRSVDAELNRVHRMQLFQALRNAGNVLSQADDRGQVA